MANIFAVPLSLQEFGEVVLPCKNPTDLQKKIVECGLAQTNEKLASFIEAIRFTFESYTDLTFPAWANFLKKVKELFPNPDQEGTAALKKFQEKVNKQFVKLFPALNTKNGESSSKIDTFYRGDTRKHSLQEILAIYTKNVRLHHLIRFEAALEKEDTSTDGKKVQALQIILSHLLMEKNLMNLTGDFLQDAFEIQQVQSSLRERSELVVRLSKYTEATIFEIPDTLEQADEFTFWLQLSPFLKLRKKHKTYLCLVPTELNSPKIKKILKKFETGSNERIQHIIRFWLKTADTLYRCSLKARTLFGYSKKCNKSPLVTLPYSEQLEIATSPFSYASFAVRAKFLMAFFEEPRDMPIDELNELNDLYQAWKSNESYQDNFFNFVYDKLKEIIPQKHNKYAKDLLEDKPFVRYALEEALTKVFKEKKEPKEKKAEKVKVVTPHPVDLPVEPIPHTFNDLPGEPFPYSLDERAERWHRHPFGVPLDPENFPEYAEKPLHIQKLQHLFHALNPLVDRFISLGIRATWINSRNSEDIRIVIPTEITFGERHRGFSTYGINPATNTCYHKHFTKKMDSDLLRLVIEKTFYENDFPDLYQAKPSGKASRITSLSTGTCHIDPVFGNVTIDDPLTGACIKLFKT